MFDNQGVAGRLALIETALSTALDNSRQARNENAALKFTLFALMDSLRPHDDSEAKEWIDGIRELAMDGLSLHVDLSIDRMIERNGLDKDAVDTAEEDREVIAREICDLLTSVRGDE